MADITASAVKAFRERTGLPLMDCKKALTEAGGDEDAAIEILRKKGKALSDTRGDRETSFGRFGIYLGDNVAALVELKCESAPVTQNEEFRQLANDLAQQLATGPGAATAEELLAQNSPSKGIPLSEQKDDLFNRIREVFNVGRIVRFEGRSGAYEHPGSVVHGVLLEADGGTPEQLRDICMHIAAMSPSALKVDELDADEVAKERNILREAALKEGKPESIVDKMVDGRMGNFYAERVLQEQPFVKAENNETVGAFAAANGITLKKFVHWELSSTN
ncbi:translation elongation factor Ts [Lignipirellula cremea]|uniref:Elongation factor Ts n=1 Tax=Lignipirellula cremea TaxID=2528010 RepID=A0A518DN19_9BACT|nr:translation elongation factor Ts [Lignipirellula cremea]QDU93235.1 Elongation factor Ts [Lignipirellula cremea]